MHAERVKRDRNPGEKSFIEKLKDIVKEKEGIEELPRIEKFVADMSLILGWKRF